MKIIAVSDTHGRHRRIDCPSGDLLIHAGDLTNRGTLDELEDVVRWLDNQPCSRAVVVGGNHDFCLDDTNRRDRARQILSDVTYLENESVVFNGYRFWGSPYTPTYGQWAFQKDRGDPMADIWSEIPGEVDVLITHGPPRGYGDRVRDGRRVGCEQLTKQVEAVNPKCHFFGHIHEGYGRWDDGGTRILNVSSATLGYESLRDPVVVEV